MKKWAVEQSFFDSGLIRVKIRRALKNERDERSERVRCDCCIDTFKKKKTAKKFLKRLIAINTAKR